MSLKDAIFLIDSAWRSAKDNHINKSWEKSTLMECFPGTDFDLVGVSEGQPEDVTDIQDAIERHMDVDPKDIQDWVDYDQQVDACVVMTDKMIVDYIKAPVSEEDEEKEEVKNVFTVTPKCMTA